MSDTWEKPRSNGTHLTADEIKFIRDCFKQRLRISYTAEKLKCATRTVSKYYGFFRAEGIPQRPRIDLSMRRAT